MNVAKDIQIPERNLLITDGLRFFWPLVTLIFAGPNAEVVCFMFYVLFIFIYILCLKLYIYISILKNKFNIKLQVRFNFFKINFDKYKEI